MSYGDDIPTMPETEESQGWPCLRQFCVFMENKVGRLQELFRQLERHDLRVIAVSVNDSADFSTVRLMVDCPDRARELLTLSNFTFFENDMLGVLLPDVPQPMLNVCLALMRMEMNIQYAYPLLYRKHGRGAIALSVDDIDSAIRVLEEKGHTLITESDLEDDDEFLS